MSQVFNIIFNMIVSLFSIGILDVPFESFKDIFSVVIVYLIIKELICMFLSAGFIMTGLK